MVVKLLWPPCVADADIYFWPVVYCDHLWSPYVIEQTIYIFILSFVMAGRPMK